MILIAVSIVAIMICLIISLFILAIIKQHRKVLKWQQARIKAEIDTLENERKRIASDLHDELGPMLSAIKLQINHLEPSDETETAVLSKSSNQIDSIIQRFRDISYDLLPNTLIRKGLVKAVEEFIDKLKRVSPVKIRFTSPELHLNKDQELNIFRILQEIIHNAIKHSRASSLDIQIQNLDNAIRVSTVDDGVGFNYEEKLKVSNGLGLLNLESRAEVLNGKWQIITAPGKGSRFILDIPKD